MSDIKQSFVQLNRTDLWLPRAEAKDAAISVYTEFAMNIGNIEDLSALSHVFHTGFQPEAIKQFLNDDITERLTKKYYIENTLGELASRLTLKAQVAASMVVAEVDEGTVSGYLVEPFVGKEVFPELYGIYQRNRREAKMN